MIKYLFLYFMTLMMLFYAPVEKKINYVTYPKQYKLSATYYNNVKAQCDSSPHITANGTYLKGRNVNHLRYVAMSRDMIKTTQYHTKDMGYNPNAPFEFGDTIIVKNAGIFNGQWRVMDSTNKRFKKRLDFLVSNRYIRFDSGREITVFKKEN